jgi:predicted RND superfamily exporter protein
MKNGKWPIDREAFFRRLSKFAREKHRWILVAASILAGVSALFISRLEFQSDVAHLLPSSAPRTQAFMKFLKDFGAPDSLFIILEGKRGQEMDPFVPFAEAFAERLLATGEIAAIQGRMDSSLREKIVEHLIPKALLFLPSEALEALGSLLSDEGIRRKIQEQKMKLQSPLGAFTSQRFLRDPLDLWSLFAKHLPAGLSAGEMETGGLFFSPDRRMLLLIAKPKGSPTDVDYDERLLQTVRGAEEAARKDWVRAKKDSLEADLRELTIGLTGGYIHALEDRRLIRQDLIRNFSLSMAGVLLLFFLAFRSWITLFYAFLSLLLSPLITLALFAPLGGRLSESTGAFAAIILGLSIDFIILLYARYQEERRAHGDFPTALEKSLIQTGPAIFTGAVTTAAVYGILLVSAFRGIQELGALTGTGILLSMLCAFLLFPALLTLSQRREEKRIASPLGPDSRFPMAAIGLWALRKRKWVISLSGVLSILALGFSGKVRIHNDPQTLRPSGHSAMFWESRMQEKMARGEETILIVRKCSTSEEALEFHGTLKAWLEGRNFPKSFLAGFETLASFLPPLSQQKRNLQWLAAQSPEIFDPQRVGRALRDSLQEAGFRVEPFAPAIQTVQRILANREWLTVDGLFALSLGPFLSRFLQKEGPSHWTVAYLHPGPDFWNDPQAPSFFRELEGMPPGTILITGPRLVRSELEHLMAREAWRVLFLSFLAVSALLYLDFRSLRLTFLCLIPVILASVWTLGIMGLWGLHLNFMNLIVFSMVLGIAVDYGLHVLHRLQEGPKGRWTEGLVQVSRGVMLAALTTLFAFGSLVLSRYPGLQSMGAVALMGIGFSALLALTLVPCLFGFLKGKGPSPDRVAAQEETGSS